MKLQFNPNLDFQAEAVASIAGIFKGQETCQTNFTVSSLHKEDGTLFEGQEQNDLGIGNRLRLIDEELTRNVREIQLQNGLRPANKTLDAKSLHFSIEMETGTGKTYVYLRTILELNKQYGFTKFIIVVPSVAIKEGVHKSIEITADHFKTLYDNVRFDYFIYDSQKLGQVRNFATSDAIQIMVINIDAFRKSFDDPEKEAKANIIHRYHDRMGGERPIEFIRQTNPIVIIDEPQSVDNTTKSKEAIRSLNPLCTLRYSATHIEKYEMMYRLDSVDAYEKKLVKQIEVASLQVHGGHNRAYLRLLKVDNKGGFSATVELDELRGGTVHRIKTRVFPGEDLYQLSGERDVYQGYVIDEINTRKGGEFINFTSRPEILQLGEAIGEGDDDQFKRLQIRKTIEEHLLKEKRLRPLGIKVLSLFFIDRVANYRDFDDHGQPLKGKYAVAFEEEYAKLIRRPEFNELFEGVDLETAVEGVHDGYFAVDKRKTKTGESFEAYKDSRGEGKTVADESAYQLIMRDKEKLLSFDSKLKFIFSHSALREGWDNPNVFQICTLNETASTLKKRQEIGRGLRLAVNQDGERIHGFDVNTLTVMANESYDDFARQLQIEIEQDEKIRFGVVEEHLFAGVVVSIDGEKPELLGMDKSKEIWSYLLDHKYIDEKGRVQDDLRRALKSDHVDLPEFAQAQQEQIKQILRKVAGKLNVNDASKRTRIELNKEVFLSEEFKELWDRIKYKTTFRVEFDPEKLRNTCADEIRKNMPPIARASARYTKGQLQIDRGGVQSKEAGGVSVLSYDESFELPDIVTFLQDATNLTRRTIVEILIRCNRFSEFKRNPQKFIEYVTEIIRRQMRLFIVDGIKYRRIGNDHYYAQELLENEELLGYLERNTLPSSKGVYNHVVYDSDVEKDFAAAMELSEDVKLYAKLPGWFQIDTPLGSYNPDWAVLVQVDGHDRLYFVVETKGSVFTDTLRQTEQAKIECGREHFKALETNVDFKVTNDFRSIEIMTAKENTNE